MNGRHLLKASMALSAAISFSTAFAAARTEGHDCTLNYKKSEASVPKAEFENCLASFMQRKDDVESFYVLASTGPSGKLKANLNRAEIRLSNLKKRLGEEFPNARVQSLVIGPNRQLGESVRLHLTAITAETKAAMSDEGIPVTTEDRRLHSTAGVASETGEPQIEPAKSGEELPRVSVEPVVKAEGRRENLARIAARLGQDALRDSDESFPIIGLEVAYVRPNTGVENLRTEIGGTAASMSKGEKVMKQASAHALLGAGFNMSGLVVGARALGGGVWDEDNKWRDDFGGEGRLGFENKTVSVFAGVGRTQKTSRFGLDVGLML